jgi:hypothetical protein
MTRTTLAAAALVVSPALAAAMPPEPDIGLEVIGPADISAARATYEKELISLCTAPERPVGWLPPRASLPPVPRPRRTPPVVWTELVLLPAGPVAIAIEESAHGTVSAAPATAAFAGTREVGPGVFRSGGGDRGRDRHGHDGGERPDGPGPLVAAGGAGGLPDGAPAVVPAPWTAALLAGAILTLPLLRRRPA